MRRRALPNAVRGPRPGPSVRLLAALLVALLVAGCGGPDGPSTPEGGPGPSGSTDPTPAGGTEGSPARGGTPPPGGTADRPATVQPDVALLEWRRVPGSVADTTTMSGDWRLTVEEGGARASLTGPAGAWSWASSDEQVSDALIDGRHALVVQQDRLEERPSRAAVVDLATGRRTELDGRSPVPTTTGGTWALGDGRVAHATLDAEGRYCLASVDLATGGSDIVWCAPVRHGFNGARISPWGLSLMVFDDSRPSCRTVATVAAGDIEPFPGSDDCHGMEGLVTDDGAVWSVVQDERRIEESVLFARVGDDFFELGPGTTGTLTWCGDAAYFVRDPQVDGDPARLLRWRLSDGLAVVYESPGGQAFLEAPRCGGDTMTLTALAEAGDEQVFARLR